MRKIATIYFLLISFEMHAQKEKAFHPIAARTISFDDNWLFIKDTLTNGQQENYDDARWKKVDLPHDWSIEDLANQVGDSITGAFDKSSIGSISTGFTIGGTGWYRKKFTSEKIHQNKIITIDFDGVYMNSDLWLNGHHLGNHPYGYTPFHYDLTPFLKLVGQENILAVRVRNEGRNSRWYSGSGIYRHVSLTATERVHIAYPDVYITTPQVSKDKATVQVKSSLINQETASKNIKLITTIVSPEGKIVRQQERSLILEPNVTVTDSQNIIVSNPLLWSIETPKLYKAITDIKVGSKTIDRVETIFGIRSLHFNSSRGFTLNGKKVLLKGGCIHHDNGPLGAAAIDRAEERKIEILKKNGFNAIRTSHNPPSQSLLDACDRLGVLVIDEAFDMWERPKNLEDYHLYFKDWWQKDIEAMILRDRNHPSIICWSIGNEIPERADTSGLIIAKRLADEVHQLDPTRPVTEAICGFWESSNRGKTWNATAPAFALLDIGGYNYEWGKYESDHRQFPHRVIMGTESFPKEALENWNMAKKYPYVIGDFVWTAFDYVGEASIGHAILSNQKATPTLGWPWYNAWCGDIDIIGNKKPQSYYRDVVWRQTPIAMAVHESTPDSLKEIVSPWGWPQELQGWTWPGAEGKPLQVRVFSRAPLVRLTLNGKVIAEQKIPDTTVTAVFRVPYEAGTLKAVNVENGKETNAVVLKTAGVPQRIRLTADRTNIKATRNDLSYVMVEVIDGNNQVIPNAEIQVQFSISGVGELAAVGNANPTDVSSFQKPGRKTFRGRCLAIIRPKGKPGLITLKAMAKGLTPVEVAITTR